MKACLVATKTCLIYAFVTQQPFHIPNCNLDTYIFVAWTIKYFSPHCCKCNSFGCIATIRCGNACHGPHSDSLYSGSEHSQFNSPRLVKREVGFPNPRQALIGSNQLWRVNDSPYHWEYTIAIRECSGFEIKGSGGAKCSQIEPKCSSVIESRSKVLLPNPTRYLLWGLRNSSCDGHFCSMISKVGAKNRS